MDLPFRPALVAYIAREALPLEKFGHQPRLYALSVKIGAGMAHDDDVLYAAAWLHDLGVFVGHRPDDPKALASWDNVAYALERAPGVLRSAGFPEAKMEAVVEAIRTHQPSGCPTTVEGVILRDADILEQLGAVGVLRTVCKVGRDTRFSTFTEAAASLRKALDTLPPRIALPSARALAQPRILVLRKFLEAVADESAGELH